MIALPTEEVVDLTLEGFVDAVFESNGAETDGSRNVGQ